MAHFQHPGTWVLRYEASSHSCRSATLYLEWISTRWLISIRLRSRYEREGADMLDIDRLRRGAESYARKRGDVQGHVYWE
jgi:hypothetical protein